MFSRTLLDFDQSRAIKLGLKDFRQGPEAEMDKGSINS